METSGDVDDRDVDLLEIVQDKALPSLISDMIEEVLDATEKDTESTTFAKLRSVGESINMTPTASEGPKTYSRYVMSLRHKDTIFFYSVLFYFFLQPCISP